MSDKKDPPAKKPEAAPKKPSRSAEAAHDRLDAIVSKLGGMIGVELEPAEPEKED